MPETLTPETLEHELSDSGFCCLCEADLRGGPHKDFCRYPAIRISWELDRQRIAELERAVDAMMRDCGSEPESRYARNACIIGAAALRRGVGCMGRELPE